MQLRPVEHPVIGFAGEPEGRGFESRRRWPPGIDRATTMQYVCPMSQTLKPRHLKWITTAEAARRSGKTARSIRLYVASGLLRHVKIGRDLRVNPDDLEKIEGIQMGRPKKPS